MRRTEHSGGARPRGGQEAGPAVVGLVAHLVPQGEATPSPHVPVNGAVAAHGERPEHVPSAHELGVAVVPVPGGVQGPSGSGADTAGSTLRSSVDEQVRQFL